MKILFLEPSNNLNLASISFSFCKVLDLALLNSTMSHGESKLEEPDISIVGKRKTSQQNGTEYAIFTGRTLQVVLFILALGCLIPAFVIVSQLYKLRVESHELHRFYLHFMIAGIFYAAVGIATFAWCLLDYFMIHPRFEKQRNLERAVRRKFNRYRIIKEDPIALRRRLSRERRRKATGTQKGDPVRNSRGRSSSESATKRPDLRFRPNARRVPRQTFKEEEPEPDSDGYVFLTLRQYERRNMTIYS